MAVVDHPWVKLFLHSSFVCIHGLDDLAAQAQKLAIKAVGLIIECLHDRFTCVPQRLKIVGFCKKLLMLGHEGIELLLCRSHCFVLCPRT
jgi:hypothetical protein